MSAPLTQTQLPMESILDVNGKQTYLGNGFVLPMTGASLTNTSETNLAVIKNPAGSGKSLFINTRRFSTDLNPVLIQLYASAVLNVPGSPTTVVNLRSGANTASISLCYLGATTTSNGTLVLATQIGLGVPAYEDLLYVVDPGTNILITGTQTGAGTSVVIAQIGWYEI